MNKSSSGDSEHVYIDESIHAELGVIVTAFAFCRADLPDRIARALASEGLTPGVDEFRSTAAMEGQPNLQRLRMKLYEIATEHTRVGFLISSTRDRLGDDIAVAIKAFAEKHGIEAADLKVFVDQGIKAAKGDKFIAFNQDSRIVFGLQIADALANAFAQVVKARLREDKTVVLDLDRFGAQSGELSWAIRLLVRRAFLTQAVIDAQGRHIAGGLPWRSSQIESGIGNSRRLGPDDDVAEEAQFPHFLGFGLQVSADLSETVRAAVEEWFSRLWLGCIH